MAQVGMFDDPAPARPQRPLTVSEAIQRAHRTLENRIGDIWIEGEVSNLHHAGSGHAFFTLKDERAALPVAMWRSNVQRLRFRLEAGQRLRVFGRMGIYPAQGKFQLYAERAEPVGLGELMLQFEQLKARLEEEGLFATERKRPLPRWPRLIGVVTSRQGAAIHDVLKVIRRRCPSHILLSPASVQGDMAPSELRAAVHRLEAVEEVDVIVIGRGGGSMEDLWAFNNEGLARVLANCRVPVISAVGHEVDVTIADMVADVRAATPSHAGELVVPDLQSIMRSLDGARRRIELAYSRRALDERRRLDEGRRRVERVGRALLGAQRQRLDRATRSLGARARELLTEERDRLDDLSQRLSQQHPRVRIRRDRRRLDRLFGLLSRDGRRLVTDARYRLGQGAAKLDALSPLSVLDRGYAVVTDSGAQIVSDADSVKQGDALDVRLAKGRLQVTVQGKNDE
jgi:exodeoxyribonuclease VII large subunit